MTASSVQAIRQLFRQRHGLPPVHVVQCPRFIELLGDQAIDPEGLALAIAVDHYLEIAVAPRSDGKVHLAYEGEEECAVFSISDLGSQVLPLPTRYFQSVLVHLARRGVPLRGFSAVIRTGHSEAIGGLSAMALSVGTAMAFRELQPYALTLTGCTVPPLRNAQGRVAPPVKQERLEMARLCQAAVQVVDEESSSMLPAVTCLFGRAFQAVELDGQSLAVELVPLAGEVSWVICQAVDGYPMASGLAQAWRAYGQEAVRGMGVKSLRAVDEDRLKMFEPKLSVPARACVRHAVEEVRRVLFGARALRDGDFEQFGQYLNQSHESLSGLPENHFAELTLLAKLARLHPGCLGVRSMGGAGELATINLVRHAQAESFRQAMEVVYEKQTGQTIRSRICRVVDGVGVLNHQP